MTTTLARFCPADERGVRNQNVGFGISGRPEPAQAQHSKALDEIRPTKSGRLVGVRPDEELPSDFSVGLRRILIPTALDKASAVALDYTSRLGRDLD